MARQLHSWRIFPASGGSTTASLQVQTAALLVFGQILTEINQILRAAKVPREVHRSAGLAAAPARSGRKWIVGGQGVRPAIGISLRSNWRSHL